MAGPDYNINDLSHTPIFWLESSTATVDNYVLDSMRYAVWAAIYAADPLNALVNSGVTPGTGMTVRDIGKKKNRVPFMWGHYDFESDEAGSPSQCKKKFKCQDPITAVSAITVDTVSWKLTSFIGGRFEYLQPTY